MRVADTDQIGRSRASRAASLLKGPALLALIMICLFWKLTLTRQYTWLDSTDFANQVLPWYQFQASAWHSGQFPLWDPHEWGGQSLIGQVITGAAYPLNWILFLLPLKHGWINLTFLNWYFVAIHYMGALFCFLLLRDLKRSFAASLLGSVAFATAGYFVYVDWPQMLNGAVWAPLVLLFFLRTLRGERPLVSAALSGTFLGVSLLSGHHQAPIFVGLVLAGLWIFHLIAMRQAGRLPPALASMGLFGVFTLLAGGFQVLPAIEYGQLSLRWVGASHPLTWSEPVPYQVHSAFSFNPQQITNLILPGGDPDIAYMGLVVFTLALFAVASAWQDRMVRIFTAVTVGGLLLVLGGNAILHGVLYALLPLVGKARTPLMAMLIYNLGISVLAAYGLDACMAEGDRARNVWVKRFIAFLSVVGVVIVFYLLIFVPVKLEHPPEFNRYGFEAVMAFLLAVLLYGWSRERISLPAGAVLVVLLAVVELGSQVGYRMPSRDLGWPQLERMSQHADIAGFLREQPGRVRLEFNRDEIPYNFGDWYGIDGFECYLASLTGNIEKIRAHPHVRQMFGINFYLGTKPLNEAVQTYLFTSKSGVKVWANPDTFPRAWSVHEAVSVHDQAAIEQYLEQPTTELARQTFLRGIPPQLETCAGPDEVSLVSRETNSLAVEANMRCKGMVVVGEGFFPGWVATVDGVGTPVYEAYTFLRGVVAGAGRHHIEMRYRPASVFWGGAMTAIGLAGACLLAVFAKW